MANSILLVSDIDLAQVVKEISRKDKKLGAFIKRTGPCTLGGPSRGSHYESIVYAVVSQQLSTKAADTISRRLVELVGSPLEPKKLLQSTNEQLRSVGLSGAKTRTIREFSQAVQSGDLDLVELENHPDDHVVAELSKLWGIGRWTAEMCMMFRMGRLDVWPAGDLGVRNGFARIYGLDEAPSEKEIVTMADHLRPYRSVVAWYCWRALDETK
ncbi:MAG: DNA-3-methyladenine glycosylase [Actinomycetales bacterium]|nr:DNA-3-methyladenine glycosylase [Actinomycetales bacterium]